MHGAPAKAAVLAGIVVLGQKTAFVRSQSARAGVINAVATSACVRRTDSKIERGTLVALHRFMWKWVSVRQTAV